MFDNVIHCKFPSYTFNLFAMINVVAAIIPKVRPMMTTLNCIEQRPSARNPVDRRHCTTEIAVGAPRCFLQELM